MDVQKKWINKERLAIAGAAAIFVLFNWILWDQRLFNFIFNDAESRAADAQKVGEISEAVHDTRLKSQRSMNWRTVESAEPIYSGDSVFTGEKSNVSVTMSDGGKLDLGENTLIFFKNVKGIQIPTLAQGKFKISVEGKMKVSINNQITEVDGKNSELEMTIKKGRKPQVRLLRGSAEIKISKKSPPVVMTKSSSSEVTLNIAPPPPKAKAPPAKSILSAATIPEPFSETEVPDLPEDIQIKAASEQIVETQPEPEPTPEPPVVMATPTPAPEPAPIPAADPSKVLRAFAGPSTYDYTQKLYDLYDANGPTLTEKHLSGYSVSLPVQLGWEMQGALAPGQGKVEVEYSQFPDFSNSKRLPTPPNPVTLNSVHEGVNYWRLTLDGRPSDRINTFFVSARPLASKPRLQWQSTHLMLTGGSVAATGKVSSNISTTGYVIESSVKSNFTGDTKISWTSSAALTLNLTVPGVYYIRARAANQNTELTQFSEVSQIFVEKPVPVRLTRAAATPTPVPRRVASEELPAKKMASSEPQPPSDAGDSVQKIVGDLPKEDDNIPNYLNRNYSSSRFKFELSGFTLYSAEQLQASGGGTAAGSALGVGVRNWLGNNGYDVNLMTTAASNGYAKPMTFDASYLHRWFARWNPFSDFNQSEIAWLLGLEYYKNSGSGIFSQSYDLIRTGLLFDFPLVQRWSTGGELIGGYWMDQSQKYEISGFVNYIFRSQWSLGGGYRLNLFQGGTQSTPPKTLVPYREAFGEFYSSLQFHY